METVFYLDKHVGSHVFFIVEDGVVIRTTGDSKMSNEIRERYVGKEISFVKTDIEQSLYKVRLHPLKSSKLLENINWLQGEIRRINEAENTKSVQLNIEVINARVVVINAKIEEYKKELVEEKQMLKESHRYNF